MEKIVLLLVSLIVTLFLSNAHAVWEVKNMEGAVKAKNGLQMIEVKKRAKLAPGTKVITAEDGRLRLQDGSSVLFIGKSTQLVLPTSKDPKNSVFELAAGRLRAILTPSKSQQYQIKTPASVVGVRGTEFYMYSDKERDIICTLKGKVGVNVLRNNQNYEVKQGKGLYILPDNNVKLLDNEKDKVKNWLKDTNI